MMMIQLKLNVVNLVCKTIRKINHKNDEKNYLPDTRKEGFKYVGIDKLCTYSTQLPDSVLFWQPQVQVGQFTTVSL